MVRAAAATSYGGPESVELIRVPSRAPGSDEVVISVRATALNPYDAKVVAGVGTKDPARLPIRLGSEASGVLTAVGADAVALDGSPLAVGDEVYGHRLPGAQAEEITVPGNRLLHKPAAASFAEAAGLLAVGTTAAHAVEAVRVGPTDVVLVHGASGGVGRMVAQLAILRSARVIGTASARRHADLEALGVEPVEYGDGLLERVTALAPNGVDAAIDTVGTDEALAVSLRLMTDPARFVTIVNFAAALAAGGQAIGGGPGADPGREIRAAAQTTLAELFADGQLSVEVAAQFPLAEVRAAYDLLVDGHAGGKIILVP